MMLATSYSGGMAAIIGGFLWAVVTLVSVLFGISGWVALFAKKGNPRGLLKLAGWSCLAAIVFAVIVVGNIAWDLLVVQDDPSFLREQVYDIIPLVVFNGVWLLVCGLSCWLLRNTTQRKQSPAATA